MTGHGLDPADPAVSRALDGALACRSPTDRSDSVTGVLVVVHKAAAEIGELGDNTAALRQRSAPTTCCNALCAPRTSTAWCRPHPVGVDRHHLEPNAHPRCPTSSTPSRSNPARRPCRGDRGPQRRRRQPRGPGRAGRTAPPCRGHHRRWADPHPVSRGLVAGRAPREAFRAGGRTPGGVGGDRAASAAPRTDCSWRCGGGGNPCTSGWPTRPSSSPGAYGVVEETATYLRLDGETPRIPTTRSRVGRSSAGRRDGPARSTASGAGPTTAPSCR